MRLCVRRGHHGVGDAFGQHGKMPSVFVKKWVKKNRPY